MPTVQPLLESVVIDAVETVTTPQPLPAVSVETRRQGDELALMFERLAKDPAVDVSKLERLIEMQERILKYNAKAAFDAEFSRMQSEMPEVGERGQILVKGTLRSTYAKLEDIHAEVKPILKAHGFAIRHRTEWPSDKPGIIRIVGILSHEQGHSEESVFEAPMDKSDYRTDIQSMGSTVSYGRRYTTLDLLNIATRGVDDDGRKAAGFPSDVVAPDGFERWYDDLTAVADNGSEALQKMWEAKDKKSIAYKNHLVKTNRQGWERLKAKAAAVKVS